jgi:SAM-dependent methyltransferase
MNVTCRFCSQPLEHVFCDLGMSPLANAYLREEQLHQAESFYPLRTFVCSRCFLVQLEEFESPEEIFSDYAYFSSYSDSWLEHCRRYTQEMRNRFGLGPDSKVIELASNDGYLLQYFKEAGIPVLGVEPAANVASVATDKGIPTLIEFFGVETAGRMAADGHVADLLLGNNVLAHVPDLNDFVAGMKLVLESGGVITMEFPHLLRLMEFNQFDTIYHEHFSYFSLHSVDRVFSHHGLTIFDVDELPTHGGSLRIYGQHSEVADRPRSEKVTDLLQIEDDAGLTQLTAYGEFASLVQESKCDLLDFLITAKREGKQVVGYGAPAKGNTLLNFCGIGRDFIDYTVDRSPAKQGRYLPGTHIPIYSQDRLAETKPDYILILPWNITDEIVERAQFVRDWGGQFVTPIPRVEILP